jgi:hypothetical protein
MNFKKGLLYVSVISAATLFIACGDNDSNEQTQNSQDIIQETQIELKSLPEYSERMYRHKTTSNFNIGSSQSMVNYEATITSMCYTKHEQIHNPCYVCHQNEKYDGRANRMGDGDLQNEYAFSDLGMTNQWTNLFVDRREKIANISDAEIDTYVNQENYSQLKTLLEENDFAGYIPDLKDYHLAAEAFYADGVAKDGSGWVAFNYKPLPSTFWPVNGSTDDVLIRLAKKFRQAQDGNLSTTVYKFNLAIVEAAIKNLQSISVDNLDENTIQQDLNRDGVLSKVNLIYRPSHYVGMASEIPVEPFLYPQYTEFLHSVRYIGAKANGEIYNAPRMKELRYMIKAQSYEDASRSMTKENLAILYELENLEKSQGWLPSYTSLGEKGINNKYGWWIQGFIEDASGALRPQSFEETFFCMGCHTTLGTTIDQVFSFARKVDGASGWGYIDLRKMLDAPNVGENEGEILTYFKRVGGGNEFRITNDVNEKFFIEGTLDEEKVKSASSIYELITPTRESALTMNKSYKVLVEEQDFIHGRDGNAAPVENVYRKIEPTTPSLQQNYQYEWDIRLDWSKVQGDNK